jgi:toxin secretion/phage lysis holin
MLSTLSMEQFKHVIEVVSAWAYALPLAKTLCWMVFVDIIAGILVAMNKRTLNSTISFRGMSRKVMMFLMVGVGVALEPLANGIPVGQLAALAFVVTEAISICENAAALGLPMPRVIMDVLIKLKEDQQKRIEQKLPTIKVEIPTQPGSTTDVTVSRPTETPVDKGDKTS